MSNVSSNPSGSHGGNGSGSTTNTTVAAFDKALEDFKKDLKKKDKDNFQMTSLQELNEAIAGIQKKQQTERRMQNMTRLKRFIEAINEYGKVIETFCNSSHFIPFIWGPMKFLLQVTNTYSDAFSELLDTYQRIGENLPLLLQYQTLFQQDPRIGKILAHIYEDLLEFHRRALRYFQQPMWRQLYQASWKTYKTRFSGLVENMAQHRSLIERQANLSQIEEARKAREESDAQFKNIIEGQDHTRRQAVYNWFRASNMESEQYYFSAIRAEYPNTGRWLLAHETFKLWIDPQFPSIPPLLWVNGIPGAGKTILTSLVIEEVQSLNPRPTVLYYYCKYGDAQRDNFISVARSFLSQLLQQNTDLLPYFYEQASNSAEVVLTSPAITKELLDMGIKNCKSAYIIIDGLDECSRDERKSTASWFRKLVEELPPANAESIRCLFVSQDDGIARKDFAGLSAITIRSQDSKLDILEYSSVWAERIKEKFSISDDMRNNITTTIMNTAEGMFLLAKLICSNLYQQTSIEGLEDELAPNNFPKEINEAYSRIISRVFMHASEAEKKDILMLLGWLVCAKSPFKWHEIQGAKSINLDKQTVDWERRRFQVNSKDLCGSLVEVRSDETVELVHLTAKFFLVEEKHVVVPREDIKLANLCIDYLNLPCFGMENMHELIFSGYYAFMDYAVTFWVRHLEAGTISIEEEDDEFAEKELMKVFLESLECFLDIHWAKPAARLLVSKRNSDRLQRFKEEPFYDTLEQAVVSTRKQLTFYGKIKKEEIVLDLGDIVQKVRNALEAVLSRPMNNNMRDRIQEMYGTNLYKCPRFSCNYFSNGFSTKEQRDQHIEKHDRPFRCTVDGCPTVVFGLASAKDLEKHMKDTHGTAADQDQEFPNEHELAPPAPPESPKEVDFPAPIRAAQKKRKAVFTCEFCSKVFTRLYNLQSHLATHRNNRPFSCKVCQKGFARQNDCKRHENSHDGERFTCTGVLRDGSKYGCGKAFTRADSLRNHHKSNTGKLCMLPFVQEQELEQENIGTGNLEPRNDNGMVDVVEG